ncbi:MAG: hypothetical protein FWB91_13950 [Defluviitaleaceae bacterium]|nr:hypothetical protein [Defluviitaleaceae bacterium]
MTRKQALHKAFEALTDEAAKKKIAEILADMPFTGWSESTIFDTINQFIIDHGRPPTTTDFKKKGLPPHTVIKLRFNMTLREFLNKHYPDPKLCSSKIYFAKTKEHWQNIFLNDYRNNSPSSAAEHDANRTKNTPTWQTIAKMFGITKWTDWLNFCKAAPHANKKSHTRNKTTPPPIQITSSITYTCKNGQDIHIAKENGVILAQMPHK